MSNTKSLIPEYLETAYDKLLTCDLVTKGDLSKDSLYEFECLLNSSIPHPRDFTIANYTRLLCKDRGRQFLTLVKDSITTPLILWSNGKTIAYHFGLVSKIYIAYNKEQRKFAVMLNNRIEDTPYQPREKTYTSKYSSCLDDSM